jgi:hypothetical protein
VLAESKNTLAKKIVAYMSDLSNDPWNILKPFKFNERDAEFDKRSLVCLVAQSFANVNLQPFVAPNESMDLVSEELLGKFAEISKETVVAHCST